eukprot:evm.model.NODE_30072_length_3891_cov_8.809047.1
MAGSGAIEVDKNAFVGEGSRDGARRVFVVLWVEGGVEVLPEEGGRTAGGEGSGGGCEKEALPSRH